MKRVLRASLQTQQGKKAANYLGRLERACVPL
jgi:hypothetical protein